MEAIELDDDDDFLSIIDAVEAKAVKNKRQKTDDEQKQVIEIEEGAYMAALRGSRSSLWKKQQQQQQQQQQQNQSKKRKEKEGLDFGSGLMMSENEKACPCGLGNCLVLTSNTAKNPGRKFYRCPIREENGGCNFFEWCDNPSSGLPTSGCALTEGKSPYGMPKRPNEASSVLRQSAFYSQTQFTHNNNSSNPSSNERGGSSCFKCGQEGHWARDCTKSSSDFNAVKGNNLASSGVGSCFKCGRAGHWARDCNGQGSIPNAKDRKASQPSFCSPFINK